MATQYDNSNTLLLNFNPDGTATGWAKDANEAEYPIEATYDEAERKISFSIKNAQTGEEIGKGSYKARTNPRKNIIADGSMKFDGQPEVPLLVRYALMVDDSRSHSAWSPKKQFTDSPF